MTGSGAECAAIAFVTQPPDETSEAEPRRLGEDVRGQHRRLAIELGPDGHAEIAAG